MRILYVNGDPGIPVFGTKGASVHVRSLAGALARAGHDVLVATRRRGSDPGLRAPFDVVELDGRREAEPGQALRDAFDTWNPDLVYERYALDGVHGGRIARERDIPHFLEVNAPLPEEAARYRGLESVEDARRAAAEIFWNATRILAVSRCLVEYVASYGIPAKRVALLPNAIDSRLFDPAPPVGPRTSPGDGPTLGFCGTLRPWHGIEDLVDIFLEVRRAVPSARLLVVGDGTGRDRLETAFRGHGAAAALEITGAVDQALVPDLLRRFDVALAPYPRIEPFYFSPLKVFEYMAAGVPVVASRQGDLPSLITHGLNGLLFEPGNPGEAAGLVLGLHADPLRAAALGQAGRRHVFAHHTWDARAGTVLEWAGEAGAVTEMRS